jgi:flagellar biosynthesis/type III secretory pathway M-ring protein FliF/YscJ
MDFLKAQFTRIQEQLAGLSATQKMLVVTMLTIMVMTMLFWSHWAAQPEMSPLLDQTMTTEEVGQISTSLDAQGIPHQVVGDRVLVPADRKLEILSVLGYSQALPKHFDQGFDEIIKQMNWLDPPDKTDQMFNRAKEQALTEMIQMSPGVAEAVVVIDPSTKREIGGNDVQPVATVTLTTNRNNMMAARQLAQSAAMTISGAVGGMEPDHVNVIVDGVAIPVKNPTEDGSMSGDDDVDMQRHYEDYYRTKIEQALQDIRGLMVSVTVKLDTARTTTTIHKIDPKQTVALPEKTEETSDETTGQQASMQEPGAVSNSTANGSMDLSGGGGGGSNTNSTSDKSENKVDYGNQDQQIYQNAGTGTVQTASVRIPRSYFIQSYKNDNDGKDPDDPTVLQTYITNECETIKKEVEGCAAFPTEDALFVGVYSDQVQPQLPLGQQTSGSQISGTLTRNSKEIGVGALAVISLFMILTMVKKSTPVPVVVAPPPESPTTPLNGNETVVGSASEKNAALDGMELDEETVKAEQTLEQVQQMVQSNPDAAASLVKRWLNR